MRWMCGAVLALWPVAAVAQDCDAAGSTLEMGTCLQAALEAADAELNDSYKAAIEGLAAGGTENADAVAEALRAAQRAWIGYRDLACASEAALYEGGSIAGVVRTGCLLRLTTERVTGLSEFLPN
ncbi:lysozyme inhibitor LprI family protein [Paragemmobacter straminiformis]|uniref:DUF1311 domain-containing protein n=1 Tax=Paragemmobacter straminiformis TaxID=2045119 RepID=A0A842I857_9RHOB|nr:lysozyme inhibitor LprI family protein [Gemmobacter straminiformis]MBC2835264.1 DUF1311 domain-containing protein [Gemmobacter straminiformis]